MADTSNADTKGPALRMAKGNARGMDCVASKMEFTIQFIGWVKIKLRIKKAAIGFCLVREVTLFIV
jgi:hypothetical protein